MILQIRDASTRFSIIIFPFFRGRRHGKEVRSSGGFPEIANDGGGNLRVGEVHEKSHGNLKGLKPINKIAQPYCFRHFFRIWWWWWLTTPLNDSWPWETCFPSPNGSTDPPNKNLMVLRNQNEYFHAFFDNM